MNETTMATVFTGAGNERKTLAAEEAAHAVRRAKRPAPMAREGSVGLFGVRRWERQWMPGRKVGAA